MEELVLGAQLYTVREQSKTPQEIRETFRKVAEIGYPAVQVSGLGKIDAEELDQIAKEYRLEIVCTHIPVERLENDLAAVIREHKIYGCGMVGIGCLPEAYRNSREGYLEFAGKMNAISRVLRREGLKLFYHNHMFEFQKFGDDFGMDLLIQNTDDEVEFMPDTFWLQMAGVTPQDYLKKLAGRFSALHLKDHVVVDNEHAMAEIGEGAMDFAAILKTVQELGVKWALVEQDVCRRDPFESLAISYRNLQKLLGRA